MTKSLNLATMLSLSFDDQIDTAVQSSKGPRTPLVKVSEEFVTEGKSRVEPRALIGKTLSVSHGSMRVEVQQGRSAPELQVQQGETVFPFQAAYYTLLYAVETVCD